MACNSCGSNGIIFPDFVSNSCCNPCCDNAVGGVGSGSCGCGSVGGTGSSNCGCGSVGGTGSSNCGCGNNCCCNCGNNCCRCRN